MHRIGADRRCWRQDLNLGTPARTDLESVAFGQTLLRQLERAGPTRPISGHRGVARRPSCLVELLPLFAFTLPELVHGDRDGLGQGTWQRGARGGTRALGAVGPLVRTSARQAGHDPTTLTQTGPRRDPLLQIVEATTTESRAQLRREPQVVARADPTGETDIPVGDLERTLPARGLGLAEQDLDTLSSDRDHHRGAEPPAAAASPVARGGGGAEGRGAAGPSGGRVVAHTGHATETAEITLLHVGHLRAGPTVPGGTGRPSAGGVGAGGGGGCGGKGAATHAAADGRGVPGGGGGAVRYRMGGGGEVGGGRAAEGVPP